MAVYTRLVLASSPGAGIDASECLAIWKPDLRGPHHAAFLIAALARELAEFAGRRQSISSADVVTSIAIAPSSIHSLRIDGHPVLSWALLPNGATGAIEGERDQLIAERHAIQTDEITCGTQSAAEVLTWARVVRCSRGVVGLAENAR